MTKEDIANLRISRSAVATHITNVIDRLLEQEATGDVFADTLTGVYLHILDEYYSPPADFDIDEAVYTDEVMAIARSARRSAGARRAAERRRLMLGGAGVTMAKDEEKCVPATGNTLSDMDSYGCNSRLLCEFRGEDGHGSVAGADEGRGADCEGVGLGDRLPAQNRGDESGCEAVACSDSIGHLDLGCGLEGDVAGSEDVATVDTAGENEHLEVVLAEEDPALVLEVDAGIAEHARHRHEFLIVYLEDVAALHGVAENLFGVESLTEVYIEYHEVVFVLGHGVEESVDCAARHHVALCQRAEAHGTCASGEAFQGGGVRDVVPGHVLLDVILRHAYGVKLHLHCAGRVGYLFDKGVDAALAEVGKEFFAQRVVADGADGAGGYAELLHVVGEVGGCAADFLTFGKDVPEGLAHSDYYFVCRVHDILGVRIF